MELDQVLAQKAASIQVKMQFILSLDTHQVTQLLQFLVLVFCDILDYSLTNKYKTVRTLSGYDSNGSGQIRLYSGMLSSTTDAITTLRIQDQSGSGYAQYSHFALYGVKD